VVLLIPLVFLILATFLWHGFGEKHDAEGVLGAPVRQLCNAAYNDEDEVYTLDEQHPANETY